MNNLRDWAINLRRQGWSYNVISQRLSVSKGTLSEWLRRIPYEPNGEVIQRIRMCRAHAAASKQRTRLSQIRFFQEQGLADVGRISERDLLFLGIGLYMGEGSKLYEHVRIVNSDPRLMKLGIEWLKRVCGVPNSHLTLTIHLYPDTPEEKAVVYWTRVTGIPVEQFGKLQVDRRENKSWRKRRQLPYGTAHVGVRSCGDKQLGVSLHRRIIGWIEAVYRNMRV